MNFRTLLYSTLLIALGISYIVSGALKMLPIEYLENDILQFGLGNEYTVLFQSRIIIGSEFVLGAMMIFHISIRKVLLVSLGFLAIYSFYLVYLLLEQGNAGNCGCYGPTVQMTPLVGLIKNIGIAALSLALFYFTSPKPQSKRSKIIGISIVVIGLILPFILYKIDFPQPTLIEGKSFNKMNLEILYSTPDMPAPPFDLREGKKIVIFASLVCDKCKMAMNKLEIIKRQHPELPIYAILNGEDSSLNDFIRSTELRDIPYAMFNDGDELLKVSGNTFPAIFLIDNGFQIAQIDFLSLNSENLISLLHPSNP